MRNYSQLLLSINLANFRFMIFKSFLLLMSLLIFTIILFLSDFLQFLGFLRWEKGEEPKEINDSKIVITIGDRNDCVQLIKKLVKFVQAFSDELFNQGVSSLLDQRFVEENINLFKEMVDKEVNEVLVPLLGNFYIKC